MLISLIITTYNRPDALLIVLQSVQTQSQLPYEVIIADDGSSELTRKIITDFSLKSNLKIIHSFQQDKGFRAAKSRNRAISMASGEYIILIDGDMVLHYDFIFDHSKKAQSGYFVQGTRVLLSKNRTKQVIKHKNFFFHFLSRGLSNRKNAIYSNFLSLIFTSYKNFLHGIKTCNVSFYKKDCIAVNGFNNEFEGWGKEDSEFFQRLMNNGINRKTLRFNAIQYHLWHPESSRGAILRNELLLKNTIDNNLDWCKDGINKFL
jgi:glycosyltransferase involved in cell wall biosynthesis